MVVGMVAVAPSCCQVLVRVLRWQALVGELVSAQRQRLTAWPVAATPGARRVQIEKVADWPWLMLTGTSW